MTLDDLAAKLTRGTVKGDTLTACCPAHEDSRPSLSGKIGDTGAIVLHCHAGCSTDAILSALGVDYEDLWPPKGASNDVVTGPGRPAARRLVCTYPYHDASGALVGEVVRFDPKDFRQRRPGPDGKWEWKGARLPLWKLPEVLEAVEAGRAVWLTEGEKDAVNLQARLPEGEVATTCPGGAGKWRDEHTDALEGADVIIVRDRDEAGRAHAAKVAEALADVAAVRVVEPCEGKDVTDHLAAGRTVEELVTVELEGDEDLAGEADLGLLIRKSSCHSERGAQPERLEGDEEDPNPFGIESVADLAARVRAEPPRRWLVRNLIITGTYGGFAAEDTSGKSLAALDLAINVATGGKWLNLHPVDDPGPVLMFLGEGDDHETHRRGEAVANFYGVGWDTLPIRVAHRVPKLTNDLHLARIGAELQRHPARLVILDPLYLAIAGVKTSQLAEVGAALEPVQRICQAHGATLWIAHHWNKTGTGTSRHRATGAGFPEWARVVGSVNVAHSTRVGAASLVTLEWEIVGNGIPGERFKVRRKVWADDPADLGSPLHYELQEVEAGGEVQDDHTPAQRRVLAVLDAADAPLTVKAIGDRLADDGADMPLKARTIQDALKRLAELGEAHDDDPAKGYPANWSAGPRPLQEAA